MNRRYLLAFAPLLITIGCSTEPAAKKEPEKPVEPVTGLTGLYRCYQQARTWAPDAKILRMTSIHIPEVKAEPGKAAAWQAIFVSETTHKSRAYTLSVYDASMTLRKGIFPEKEQDWTSSGSPFPIVAARTDTDAVWATAEKKGEDFSKKHPDLPITYTIENFRQTNNPAWRVIWGENASASSFSVLVDASTGQFLEVLH